MGFGLRRAATVRFSKGEVLLRAQHDSHTKIIGARFLPEPSNSSADGREQGSDNKDRQGTVLEDWSIIKCLHNLMVHSGSF